MLFLRLPTYQEDLNFRSVGNFAFLLLIELVADQSAQLSYTANLYLSTAILVVAFQFVLGENK